MGDMANIFAKNVGQTKKMFAIAAIEVG